MPRICVLAQREAIALLNKSGEPLISLWPNLLAFDPDAVHDVRVACRRCRAVFSEFGEQFAPRPYRAIRRTLVEIRKCLGPLREMDVELALLRTYQETGAADGARIAVERLGPEHARVRAETLRGLQSIDPISLKEQFARLEAGYRGTERCHLKHAKRRLSKRFKRVRRQYRTWCDTESPDDLHELRIRMKKFRYAAEVYASLYGEPGGALLGKLKSAQDAVGEWNDRRFLCIRLSGILDRPDSGDRSQIRSLIRVIESDRAELLDSARTELASLLGAHRVESTTRLLKSPRRACCDKGRKMR